MEINSVETVDLNALREITCVCLQGMDEVPEDEKSRLEKSILENIAANIGLPENSFFKAHENQKVVGYILIKGHKKLSELFVHPAYQKRSIGSSLLKHALEDSCEKGVDELVWVNAAMSAIPFYLKHGFIDFESSDNKFTFVRQLQYRF